MHRLEVQFEARNDWDKVDDTVRAIVSVFDGEPTDSGFGFGGRDLGFEFRSETNAVAAENRICSTLKKLGLKHSTEVI